MKDSTLNSTLNSAMLRLRLALITLLGCTMLIPMAVFGQACSPVPNQDVITVSGRITHKGQPVTHATIVVLSSVAAPDTFHTNGNFSVPIPGNALCGLVVHHEDCTPEALMFDTSVPHGKIFNNKFRAVLELFSKDDLKDVPEKYHGLPFGLAAYNPRTNGLVYDLSDVPGARKLYFDLLEQNGLSHPGMNVDPVANEHIGRTPEGSQAAAFLNR